MERKALLHKAFVIGIIEKFIDGLLELIGSCILLFYSQEKLYWVLKIFTRQELLEDPRDLIANGLLHIFQNLSINQQLFAAIYLLLHGAIKVGVVSALWTKRLWAFPVAGVVLSLFVLYELFLFSVTHSLIQLALMLVDIVILVLLRLEYVGVTGRASKP